MSKIGARDTLFLSDIPLFSPLLRIRVKKWMRHPWYNRFLPKKDLLSVRIFRSILLKRLGEKRLRKIETRLGLDLATMRCLREHQAAKFLVYCYDVTRNDLQDALSDPENVAAVKEDLHNMLLRYEFLEELPYPLFYSLYHSLVTPLEDKAFARLRDLTYYERFVYVLRYLVSCIRYYDYFCLKMRVAESIENDDLNIEAFYEKLALFYAGSEDIKVGTIIPGPKHDQKQLFYRVGASLITADGQHSTVYFPPSYMPNLNPLRVTKGTPFAPSGIDMLSHFITDFEKDIGKTGYQSGVPYQKIIDELTGKPVIEVGFSIGGTIAMWRTAYHLSNVSELWTFGAPAVPRYVVDEFNKNVVQDERQFDVYIYRNKNDIIQKIGELGVGYHAPENVNRYLCIMCAKTINPHASRILSAKGQPYRIEQSKDIDTAVNNLEEPFLEKTRATLGMHLFCPVLKMLRRFSRETFDTREHKLKGLWIERREGVLWQTERIVYD